ncbi:galectin-3-like [Gigantopelta aegis]|uniref:galectin-3-like n=1 Tax=Gigantopelta aegis TaxID=1735272 RepID=UPI001B8877A0|nr:galectin-3-like [Gigantopelta aegis]
MGYTSSLEQLTQITEVGSVGFAAKSCPSPPSLPNGDAVYSSLLVGSVATYTCDKDYHFCGLIVSSVCEMYQSWNGLSGSCKRVAFYNYSLPFRQNFPEVVGAGWKVEILGTPLGDSRIVIDLRHGANIPFILNIRFQEGSGSNTVVRNSRIDNIWGQEQRTQPYFPFRVGRPFNLTILLRDSAFEMYMDGHFFVSRASSYNIALINQIIILRGCLLHSVKFVY